MDTKVSLEVRTYVFVFGCLCDELLICNELFISYNITSHHITSHHITSHHITSHHITPSSTTSFFFFFSSSPSLSPPPPSLTSSQYPITSHHITPHHTMSHLLSLTPSPVTPHYHISPHPPLTLQHTTLYHTRLLLMRAIRIAPHMPLKAMMSHLDLTQSVK